MPPRIPAPSTSLLPTDAMLLQQQIRRPWLATQSRAFSATPCCEKMTRARQKMYQWLKTRTATDLEHGIGRPNYLGKLPDQPFPLNPLFRSLPVLDDETQELIWERVMNRGEPLKVVSADMSVDVRRVAAVVRLKQVQRRWEKEGKKLATPYAKAVRSMVPQTSWREDVNPKPVHEAVNELHVHSHTRHQIFLPVSESRHFTREDAARAFSRTLLSPDAQSPQRGLIEMERQIMAGKDEAEAQIEFTEQSRKEEEELARKTQLERDKAEKLLTRVKTDRYEFRFQSISADDAGPDGRSPRGVGWRYGAPLQDRKHGFFRIPTSVP